jgi:hypothetical protein
VVETAVLLHQDHHMLDIAKVPVPGAAPAGSAVPTTAAPVTAAAAPRILDETALTWDLPRPWVRGQTKKLSGPGEIGLNGARIMIRRSSCVPRS